MFKRNVKTKNFFVDKEVIRNAIHYDFVVPCTVKNILFHYKFKESYNSGYILVPSNKLHLLNQYKTIDVDTNSYVGFESLQRITDNELYIKTNIDNGSLVIDTYLSDSIVNFSLKTLEQQTRAYINNLYYDQ